MMYNFKPGDVELIHYLRKQLNSYLVKEAVGADAAGDTAQESATSPAFASYILSLLAEAEEVFWDSFDEVK